MHVRVDTGPLHGAELDEQASASRRLARAASRLGDDLSHPTLSESLGMLGDVCGDVFEVAALDLHLVAAHVRRASATYEFLEGRLAR